MVAHLRHELMTGRGRIGETPSPIVLEVWDTERKGNIPCALRAFEMGLEAFKGQSFTVLQDDAQVCRGFAEYVGNFQDTPDVIQWYAHGLVTEFQIPPAAKGETVLYRPMFTKHRGDEFVCSLATTYPPLWALRVQMALADAVEFGKPDDAGQLQGDDAVIKMMLEFWGGEFWVHVPSLVQHIGYVSAVAGRNVTLGSHAARESRCYVGRTFDARELLPVVKAPWRAKETIMDEAAKEEITQPAAPIPAPPAEPPINDRKLVGDMTARELFRALSAIEEETKDPTDGRRLAMEHAVDLGGPPAYRNMDPANRAIADRLAAEMHFAGASGGTMSRIDVPPEVCNECGAPVGDCGHEPR